MSYPRCFQRYLVTGALALIVATANAADTPRNLNTAEIERLTGLKGTYSAEENVFKVSQPRTDVKIRVDRWAMAPFMGLTSWAAFTPARDGQAMMMGDTVLFEDEVNPVMSAAFEAGLEITALHNHFFFDEPKVYFMHTSGVGSTEELARGVRRIYDKVAEIRRAQPKPSSQFPKSIPGKQDFPQAS
jgi:hypothetical protein